MLDTQLLPQSTKYAHTALGADIKVIRNWVRPSDTGEPLDYGLSFTEIRMFGHSMLAAMDQGVMRQGPGAVAEHLRQIREQWGGLVLYIVPRLTSYQRKILIQKGVPFLVPWNQLFLLPLGVDLQERFLKETATRDFLSPSTQLVLLNHLLNPGSPATPGRLAPVLGYSAMTMGRAFDELVQANLATSSTKGRTRTLHLSEDRATLWSDAAEHLASPVAQRHRLQTSAIPSHNAPKSGLAALSELSDYAAPRHPVNAFDRDSWKKLDRRVGPLGRMDPQAGGTTIEVWHYDPKLLASGERVDPLSLYLSLRDDPDEQIQAGLAQMMNAVQW